MRLVSEQRVHCSKLFEAVGLRVSPRALLPEHEKRLRSQGWNAASTLTKDALKMLLR